jgi:Xaa-Pro aminopeptidase
LEAEGLRAYVVFDELNFVYTTNFLLDVEPWERPVAAIFPADGNPSLVLHELSTNHYAVALERGSCWVTDAEIYVEHPTLINRKYSRPEWDRLLVDRLVQQGATHGRVGVDSMGRISAAVRAMLPDVEFSLRPELIRDLRVVKSEAEIDILRVGGVLTTWAIGEFKSLLAAGERIYELSLEVAKRLGHRVADQLPDDAIQIMVLADTGIDTACPHSPGGNAGRRIARGDSVITNVLLRINGYWTEDERTFLVGSPTDEQRHYMTAMTEAQVAAIDAMVEGNRLVDIEAAALKVHQAEGTLEYLFARTGHGIGLGGHEYPDDMAYSYRPLVAGMVFSSEPAVFVRGLGGFRHSDTVVVGKDKPESVTTYSKRIEDLIVAG